MAGECPRTVLLCENTLRSGSGKEMIVINGKKVPPQDVKLPVGQVRGVYRVVPLRRSSTGQQMTVAVRANGLRLKRACWITRRKIAILKSPEDSRH